MFFFSYFTKEFMQFLNATTPQFFDILVIVIFFFFEIMVRSVRSASTAGNAFSRSSIFVYTGALPV